MGFLLIFFFLKSVFKNTFYFRVGGILMQILVFLAFLTYFL